METQQKSTLQIIQYPNEILTQVCQEIKPREFETFVPMAHRMVDYLKEKKLMCISGPKIGVLKRFLVVRESIHGFNLMFNPVMTGHRKGVIWMNEDCICLRDVKVKVPRWEYIDVKYQDENQVERKITLRKLAARAFQHEADHLNGWLIIKTTKEDDNGNGTAEA